MKPSDLLRLLDEFFREKAALRNRHMATARVVGEYDLNNACQYFIAREEQHLAWVGDAIRQMGGTADDMPAVPSLPPAKTVEAQRNLLTEDAQGLEEFDGRWRGRIRGLANARVQLLLELILGEVLEQARAYRQAATGRLDVLGRRTGGERTEGQVLSTRWVE